MAASSPVSAPADRAGSIRQAAQTHSYGVTNQDIAVTALLRSQPTPTTSGYQYFLSVDVTNHSSADIAGVRMHVLSGDKVVGTFVSGAVAHGKTVALASQEIVLPGQRVELALSKPVTGLRSAG